MCLVVYLQNPAECLILTKRAQKYILLSVSGEPDELETRRFRTKVQMVPGHLQIDPLFRFSTQEGVHERWRRIPFVDRLCKVSGAERLSRDSCGMQMHRQVHDPCERAIARSAAERCADLALPTPRAATVFYDLSSPDSYQLPV